MKTLKAEEVDGRRYRHFDDAKASIGTFIEQVYNQTRLHSALQYRSPMEFEVDTKTEMARKRKISARVRVIASGNRVL